MKNEEKGWDFPPYVTSVSTFHDGEIHMTYDKDAMRKAVKEMLKYMADHPESTPEQAHEAYMKMYSKRFDPEDLNSEDLSDD